MNTLKNSNSLVVMSLFVATLLANEAMGSKRQLEGDIEARNAKKPRVEVAEIPVHDSWLRPDEGLMVCDEDNSYEIDIELYPTISLTTAPQPQEHSTQDILDIKTHGPEPRHVPKRSNEFSKNALKRMVEACKANVSDKHDLARILKTIRRLKDQDRLEVLKLALPLITGIEDGSGRAAIIKTIGSIVGHERRHLLEMAWPLIKDIDDGFQRADVLEALSSTRTSDLASVTQIASSLIQNLDTGFERAYIIDIIGLILEKGIALPELKWEWDFIKGIDDGFQRADTLKMMSLLPSRQRNEEIYTIIATLFNAPSRFQEDTYENREKIIKKMEAIPEEERVSLLKMSHDLVSDWNEDGALAFCCFMESLRMAPKEERGNIFQVAFQHNKTLDWPVLETLVRTMVVVPQPVRSDFVGYVANMKETDPETFEDLHRDNEMQHTDLEGIPVVFLAHQMKSNPNFRKQVLDKWASLLLSHDVTQARQISFIVSANYEDLGLYEEHELVQTAIRVQILLVGKQEDQLNPYTFYAKLKNLREEKVNINPATLPIKTIDDTSVRLNPAYLKALPSITVTFKDLPQYSKDFFEKMSAQIDSRLNDQLKWEDYDTLLAGSLGSAYLPNLLNVQGNPDDGVPLLASKLIAVVAYAESLDNTYSPTALSEREQYFLMILSSIQNCTTGKDGGIEECYNMLSPTARYKATSQSEAHAFLEDIIRTEVEKMFSGTNLFFKDLMNIAPDAKVEDAIHQALYVKNLIADIGLNHRLTFDFYTQVLNKQLLTHSKADIVQAFYKHFEPQVLVAATRKAVNEGLQVPKNTLYSTLSKLMDKGVFHRAWEFDKEDYSLFSLTDFGAAHLLLKVGALEKVDLG